MIDIGFAFNFNIQRCEIEVGDEQQITDRGYKPLLQLFKKYNMKANCFISGYTSQCIKKIDPDFLKTIKSQIGKSIMLGTYTYTHPIPQLLNNEEFSRQMAVGLKIDRELLGVDTVGFLPPEFAYTATMGKVLVERGIRWFLALASQIEIGLKNAGVKADPYVPYSVVVKGKRLIVVPAAYQLPETPARFLKLMMKGQLPVDTVIEGVKAFAKEHPEGLLLFKRDGETIFIDDFNSGFHGTFEVLEEFLSKLCKLDFARTAWIEDVIEKKASRTEIELPDYLGNTKIETFTEGAAEEIWNLTKKVRDKLLVAEKEGLSKDKLERAWEYLLLSHNSDGRIGYWFSKWNPGEHKVAPSRRQFIVDNLNKAWEILNKNI